MATAMEHIQKMEEESVLLSVHEDLNTNRLRELGNNVVNAVHKLRIGLEQKRNGQENRG